MADIFISYSSKDSALARGIFERCRQLGLSAFLAEISLKPSDDWKARILEELSKAEWVVFLATPNSCASNAVMHEIGGALVLKKSFVPVRIGVGIDQLPDWIKDRQAVDGSDSEALQKLFVHVGERIRANLLTAGLVVAAIVFGLWIIGRKSSNA